MRKLSSTAHHTAAFVIGFLTRPCCSIPLALSLFGLGGAGVAAALPPYRLWLLVMAVAFFSASFYFNFIRNRSRAGMVTWTISILIAAAVQAASQIVPPVISNGKKQYESAVMTQNLIKTEMSIQGMGCSACARRLERVLTGARGVAEARVSFEKKCVNVKFDLRQIDRKEIQRRIEDAGFRVSGEALELDRGSNAYGQQ